MDLETPVKVRRWIQSPTPWLITHNVQLPARLDAIGLDEGEVAALTLAGELHATLILMDDRAGVMASRNAGFNVMGTLGVLDLSARRALVDLGQAFERLRTTTFRCRPTVMEDILSRDTADRGRPVALFQIQSRVGRVILADILAARRFAVPSPLP